MVRYCLEEQRPFGIVLIRSGEESGDFPDPYLVGTSAHIVSAHSTDDGRIDIHVRGDRRFRIRELDDQSCPYLVGKVEPLFEQDLECSQYSEELLVEARTEFQSLIEKLFEHQQVRVRVEFPTDPIELSFSIANLLPMENLAKQRLLETTDTLERVADLLPVLRAQSVEIVYRPEFHRIESTDLRDWILPN